MSLISYSNDLIQFRLLPSYPFNYPTSFSIPFLLDTKSFTIRFILSLVPLKCMISLFMFAICYLIFAISYYRGPISRFSYLILQSKTNLNFYSYWVFFLSSFILVTLSRIVFYLYSIYLAWDCFLCKFSQCFCLIFSISYRVCFNRCFSSSSPLSCFQRTFFLASFSFSALLFDYSSTLIFDQLSYFLPLISFQASV